MMLNGLGTSDPAPSTGTTAPAPTFMDGLTIWKSPSAGFAAVGSIFKNASTAFSGANLPIVLGILAVPVGLAAVLFSMSGGKK